MSKNGGRLAGTMPGGAQRIPGRETFTGSPERFNAMTTIRNLIKDVPETQKEAILTALPPMFKANIPVKDIIAGVKLRVSDIQAGKP